MVDAARLMPVASVSGDLPFKDSIWVTPVSGQRGPTRSYFAMPGLMSKGNRRAENVRL